MNQLEDINGGEGVLIAIAGAAVGYIVYEVVDEIVERTTGKDLGNHVADAIDYVF